MNAIFSTQRFLLAVAVLVVAWAPAATLARPGAQHASLVAEASAQPVVKADSLAEQRT